ncbi:17-beta-hydroxysteroid dehydrogenase 14-like [Mya arenaria]|uniref:17-beta-hydroxysteroid dehydrogenase 14-like n=1 Tax=Mya arenaria TaxID=6604 RepID=UPI0022E8A060|nr:17-beta-hydroxysteroid dehydrogenase 14-like [Mya arenaria]
MPHLHKTRGNVVNISSINGIISNPRLSMYSATKQMGRVGEPREIGLACMFLATDATFSTGMDLVCSGGAELGYGVKLD